MTQKLEAKSGEISLLICSGGFLSPNVDQAYLQISKGKTVGCGRQFLMLKLIPLPCAHSKANGLQAPTFGSPRRARGQDYFFGAICPGLGSEPHPLASKGEQVGEKVVGAVSLFEIPARPKCARCLLISWFDSGDLCLSCKFALTFVHLRWFPTSPLRFGTPPRASRGE